MWRDKIRAASFRGVPFGVLADDKEGGRRTVVHEFPQREEAFVEDLGAAALRFTVQAFVLGDDYASQRDALEKALCEPGPGKLVHPYYGEIEVSQFAPYKVRHTAQDGRMCVFTLSFARDTTPATPSSAVNAQGNALGKALAAGNAACTAFDKVMAFAGQAEAVIRAGYTTVMTTLSTVQGVLRGDVGAIARVLGAVTGYDFLPLASLGLHLWGVYESLSLASPLDDAQKAAAWQSVACGLASGGGSVAPISAAMPWAPSPETRSSERGATRQTIASNGAAIITLTRQLAVVETGRIMATSVPVSRAEAATLRDGFSDAVDTVLCDPLTTDDVAAALVPLRAATLQRWAEVSRRAPEVMRYTPAAVLPGLVVSHIIATRTGRAGAASAVIPLEADMVARNGIVHPGFVPADPLEVLLYE